MSGLFWRYWATTRLTSIGCRALRHAVPERRNLKLYVTFTRDTVSAGPPAVFLLDLVSVREFFIRAYPSFTGPQQQCYYLDRFHAAVIRCARRFGWDEAHVESVRERMLADNLQFAFWWKKPLSSPDRRIKAQGRVEAGSRTRLWLVFTDRRGNELGRCLLAEIATVSWDLRGQVALGASWHACRGPRAGGSNSSVVGPVPGMTDVHGASRSPRSFLKRVCFTTIATASSTNDGNVSTSPVSKQTSTVLWASNMSLGFG